ncbi:MAG TPA: hypothetical protein PLK99_05005 [Burkholderiales bacterium]|nr:hypothetical protein [Burkholderiales bacterium]
MKKAMIAASLVLGMTASAGTHASGTAGSDDLKSKEDTLVKSYLEESQNALLSLSELARSVGLTDLAMSDRTAYNYSFSLGTGVEALEKADKAASKSSAATIEKLKKDPQMGAMSTKHFTIGLNALADDIVSCYAMKASTSEFRKKLISESGKMDSGRYVAKTLPGKLENLASVFDSAVSYANRHDIKLSSKAEKALNLLKTHS